MKYFLIIFFLAAGVMAQTDTVTIRSGVDGGECIDASLVSGTSGLLVRLPNELTVSVRNSPYLTSLINIRTVIAFPNADTIRSALGGLPITVTSATLTLKTATYPTAIRYTTWLGDVKIYAHEVLETWDTSTNNPKWDAGQTFTDSGAGPPTSSSATKLDSITVDSSQNKEYVITLPVELVQSWIDVPDSNYGIVLISEETGVDIESSNRSFYSSNSPVDSLKPLLTVIYDLPPISIYIQDKIIFQNKIVIGNDD